MTTVRSEPGAQKSPIDLNRKTLMIAYHNNRNEKAKILRQLRAHRRADELVKGRYWEDGKGCAVGCTLHSNDHPEYEPRFGIPQSLARLEDTLFEGLPNVDAQKWPVQFMSAIQPGADLTRVSWKFLYWLLTDRSVVPYSEYQAVWAALAECAAVIQPLCEGRHPLRLAFRQAQRAISVAQESIRHKPDLSEPNRPDINQFLNQVRAAQQTITMADMAISAANLVPDDEDLPEWQKYPRAYSLARHVSEAVLAAERAACSAACSAPMQLPLSALLDVEGTVYKQMAKKLLDLLRSA